MGKLADISKEIGKDLSGNKKEEQRRTVRNISFEIFGI